MLLLGASTVLCHAQQKVDFGIQVDKGKSVKEATESVASQSSLHGAITVKIGKGNAAGGNRQPGDTSELVCSVTRKRFTILITVPCADGSSLSIGPIKYYISDLVFLPTKAGDFVDKEPLDISTNFVLLWLRSQWASCGRTLETLTKATRLNPALAYTPPKAFWDRLEREKKRSRELGELTKKFEKEHRQWPKGTVMTIKTEIFGPVEKPRSPHRRRKTTKPLFVEQPLGSTSQTLTVKGK